jgi:hypothetical protein
MSDVPDREIIVHKDTVLVELCTATGALLRGEVFVRPHDGVTRGERLLDVLAQRWFVPVKTQERLMFVAVRHLLWARLDLLAAVDELDANAENDVNSCTARVIVELVDKSRLEGSIRYAMPMPARRVGDYLEHLPMFFPITTEDFVYLVSATAVLSVTALEERN